MQFKTKYQRTKIEKFQKTFVSFFEKQGEVIQIFSLPNLRLARSKILCLAGSEI
jgi:hypothetical protein